MFYCYTVDSHGNDHQQQFFRLDASTKAEAIEMAKDHVRDLFWGEDWREEGNRYKDGNEFYLEHIQVAEVDWMLHVDIGAAIQEGRAHIAARETEKAEEEERALYEKLHAKYGSKKKSRSRGNVTTRTSAPSSVRVKPTVSAENARAEDDQMGW